MLFVQNNVHTFVNMMHEAHYHLSVIDDYSPVANTDYSLHNDTRIYENNFIAAQAKFDAMNDNRSIEASYEKMKFKEFAYKNDTIKTTILSHCNKILVKVKSSKLFSTITLDGNITTTGKSPEKIKAIKEQIIDKIDTYVDEDHDILIISGPNLEKSNIEKDIYQLNIMKYSINNILSQPTKIEFDYKKISHDKKFSFFKFHDVDKIVISDINSIVYYNNNIFISIGLRESSNRPRIIYKTSTFILKINTGHIVDCTTFYDYSNIKFLRDINGAVIIPGCGEEDTKSLITTYLEKDDDDKLLSLQLCNSRINSEGKIDICYYGKGFYNHFNQRGEKACSHGGYSDDKFYLYRKSGIQGSTLAKIGDNAVILYAVNNDLYSYIINAQTKILPTDDNNVDLIQGSQTLFSVKETNITQVHIGQVMGSNNQLYACVIDALNTLHCLHGMIKQHGCETVGDKHSSNRKTICNATNITRIDHPVRSINDVYAEVFAAHTIESLYKNGLSTTTTKVATTTEQPTTIELATTTEQPTTTYPTTTKLATTTEQPTTTHPITTQTTTKLATTTEQPTTTELTTTTKQPTTTYPTTTKLATTTEQPTTTHPTTTELTTTTKQPTTTHPTTTELTTTTKQPTTAQSTTQPLTTTKLATTIVQTTQSTTKLATTAEQPTTTSPTTTKLATTIVQTTQSTTKLATTAKQHTQSTTEVATTTEQLTTTNPTTIELATTTDKTTPSTTEVATTTEKNAHFPMDNEVATTNPINIKIVVPTSIIGFLFSILIGCICHNRRKHRTMVISGDADQRPLFRLPNVIMLCIGFILNVCRRNEYDNARSESSGVSDVIYDAGSSLSYDNPAYDASIGIEDNSLSSIELDNRNTSSSRQFDYNKNCLGAVGGDIDPQGYVTIDLQATNSLSMQQDSRV